MEEIAQSNSLSVPARGFWERLCNIVAKVGLPPYMRNDSSSIGEARAKKSPLTYISTFPIGSGITRTIIGSHVQLSSYVPEEIMRGLPIALPWKILEKVHLPSVAQSTLKCGVERKDIGDEKERPVMEFSGTSVDGANYHQDRPQSPEWLDQTNNEDSGLGDILLTTLRSPSPAEIVFGERATVQDSPSSMFAHVADSPFYSRMMSTRQTSLPNNNVVAAPFTKASTAFLTIEGTGYKTTNITKMVNTTDSTTQTTKANTTDSATQISRVSTVDSATQVGNGNTTDSATQIIKASTIDSATQINKASTRDTATQINKASTTDSATQVSKVSTTDSATQNSKASIVNSATQTKTSIAIDATTQVATALGSIAIQCSLQGFTLEGLAACSQSSTPTKSTEVICSREKADFSAQFDSKSIAESVKINEKIVDFTVDLVKRYTSVSKGEFNIAMIDQIRTKVGQFLLKIQDPNDVREVYVSSSNANADKDNISTRRLAFSEDESHKIVAKFEAPTENTDNQESDFKGVVDMPYGYKSLTASDLSHTSFEVPTTTDADADASDMESDEDILVHNDLSDVSSGTTDSDCNVPDVCVPLVELESIDWVVKDDGWSRWIIGKGCFGSVFWAKYGTQYGPTTDVAIKEMNDPDCINDIVREAKILMHLQDTGVFPQFFGYVNIGTEDEPNICLVQQMFGDGRTIAHFLTDDDTRLDQRDWMSICIQLAKGLRKIHVKDIVLNDLKENNVLLDDSVLGNPVVKFIDVGISTYTHGFSFDLTDEEIKYLPHIAPEIKYLKMASSYLSDIYSLGTIFRSISKEVGITELADVADACTRETPEERWSHETIIEYLSNVREEMGLI